MEVWRSRRGMSVPSGSSAQRGGHRYVPMHLVILAHHLAASRTSLRSTRPDTWRCVPMAGRKIALASSRPTLGNTTRDGNSSQKNQRGRGGGASSGAARCAVPRRRALAEMRPASLLPFSHAPGTACTTAPASDPEARPTPRVPASAASATSCCGARLLLLKLPLVRPLLPRTHRSALRPARSPPPAGAQSTTERARDVAAAASSMCAAAAAGAAPAAAAAVVASGASESRGSSSNFLAQRLYMAFVPNKMPLDAMPLHVASMA
ncbi:hypothetical protein JKP88DRAFT_244319 [Tribonema minus]|uniref:Uncharacterized protein n=1 Tax=Tribonema minus TaxID=303371 RepID=A0A836CH31_9STRA|nr:hypothetical protein JKP88DRAFT_244319 [Tribonema minus]